MRRWQRALMSLLKRIWFRAALFSLFAVVLALLAAVVSPFLPYEFGTKIGAAAVDNILTILASSMLAVTTFSLTAMVQAFSSATSNITPRATRLLVDDSAAQNALATFLGAFLFAIVGICALSTGLYGETGRVILFGGTIVVIALIVLTLLRWIEQLSRFGRMDDTIARVEKAAREATRMLARKPYLGATAPDDPIPPGSRPIHAAKTGQVTHVDVPALSDIAGDEGSIHVAVLPGSFVSPARAVAWVIGCDDADESVAEAFTIEDGREFDQDPRFGLVVLSEIASRALSPAVNDPGTAIAVLGAGMRVLGELGKVDETAPQSERVHVPAIRFADLLEDLIRPIARDGAGIVEVGVMIQKMLGQLEQLMPGAAEAIAARADDALARNDAALDNAADRAAVHAARARFGLSGGQ